ncbi:MAG: glycosyltransferase family 2 protein [Acidaminococcaceae bacterium]|nr:glycosyltransferase family 2 protein [Acidaminococcaceae bacterium]
MLSLIVPSCNEEASIPLLYNRTTEILLQHKDLITAFEIIFVDDGSNDNTWPTIKSLMQEDERIHGIKFSRNFGKESAIFAGLNKAKGDCAVVMDCDLQHPPELISEMYEQYLQGYQIVRCVKKHRNKEPILRKLCNVLFFCLFDSSDSTRLSIDNASDFQLLDRKVIDYILRFQETSLFFRGISAYVGFKTKDIEFDVPERVAGFSKWSYPSLIQYAFSNMSAFSSKPLQLVTFSGIILLVLAIILTIRTLYVYFMDAAAPGITTVIILLLFIGSMLMFSLGIIGFYVGKIFEEVKHRPRYIIDEEK